MLITLQQLERKPVVFDVSVEPGAIEFDGKTTQVSPLIAKGTATLLNRTLGEIRIQGNLQVRVASACDRCLESTEQAIESPFDLVYMPASEEPGGDDEVDEAGIEVGYYEGSSLVLNEVLREVVLLALPMQTICEESCKGICPVCGQNRNLQSCGCQVGRADDRWNQLRDFRPKPA